MSSEPEDHDHDRGLAFDVGTLLARRHALALLAGAGAGAVLVACGAGTDASTASSTSATTTTTDAGVTGRGPGGSPGGPPPGGSSAATDPDAIPSETEGPYPGDGSNGPDVLVKDGIVRSDITTSFGSASGVAEGVPLTVVLTVTDAGTGDPLPGHAVYLWHCDREGRYSLYSDGVEDENYLRGVQEAGNDGTVTFTTVFPGAYSGRWPHIHFEVYESLDVATASGDIVVTSQLAFPEEACDAAYAASGYEQSVANMARTSLSDDMVFSDDGAARQMATMSGSAATGYTAELIVPV